jgi:hypothetical protein
MGFYDGDNGSIRQALIEAQAYAASPACEEERDDALRDAFETWERGVTARVIFYANAAHTELAAATTLEERLGPMHELAEGLGLAAGFYGVADPASGPLSTANGGARIVTDTELEEILSLLHLSTDGTGTVNEILSDMDELDELQDGIDAIGEVYGLSADEIDDHRDGANNPG